MRKSVIILATAALFVGMSTSGCKSNSEKEADAVENVASASDNLESVENDAKIDAANKANDAEWQRFKKEAGISIDANQTRINELTVAMNKAGDTFDESYRKSIKDLKEKNESLKSKIADYENNQTDWASFKREFNSDMSEIGRAFKDLTVNNKK